MRGEDVEDDIQIFDGLYKSLSFINVITSAVIKIEPPIQTNRLQIKLYSQYPRTVCITVDICGCEDIHEDSDDIPDTDIGSREEPEESESEKKDILEEPAPGALVSLSNRVNDCRSHDG